VLAPLGAGGMGEVYRARDTRLGREVAIKVLPEEFFKNEEREGRFEREAKLLAAVSHPNIAVIYSFEEISGRYLLVQELLEGETLRERLAKGALPQHSAVEIGVEVAHGLAAAHAKGIVHRDLKPANVFVTSNGVVKLLDFGLAKLTRPEAAVTPEGTTLDREPRTESGTVLGTMGYTSPEQLRGEAADARSDIFAFGCVLYEMLSGRSPFLKPTGAETITAIMSEDPELLSGTGRAISPALKEIVNRCLEKRPDDRFSAAHDLALALRAYSRGSETPATPTAPAGEWLHRHRRSVAGATILVAMLAVTGVLIFANRKHSAASGGLPSVLALPCTVYGAPEVAFLTDAVPGTISTLLSQVEGLDTKVPATSFEVEKVKGDLTKLADLYQVSSFIVTSITSSPGRFALNVQLVDAGTRRVRWGKQYEGTRESYNDLARQAAEGLRQVVKPAASPVPTARVSSQAELALRQGTYYANRYNNLQRPSDFEAALMTYTRALEIDPSFALAAAKIAALYMYRDAAEADVHEARKQAEWWARRALGIDPRCGEAWAALSAVELYATHADPERGIDYAAKAVAFAPRDAEAHHTLGMWLGLGSASLFVAAGLRSADLDPFLLPPAGNAAAGLSCFLGRPGEALTVIDRALRVEPDFAWGSTARGFALLKLGRLEEAERELRRSEAEATKGHTGGELWRQIRFALAVAQRDDATSETLARQIVASVFGARSDANLVGNAEMFAAPALARMGRKDDAIRILEKGVEVGAPPNYEWLLVDPDFQSLRGDPRFAKVLVASRDGAAMVARILGQSRARGELPKYLEGPLDDLVRLLKKPAG